ncbi:MAG TPA: excinuclease ABC subunit UvrC [Accumulibacter sp.]|nr:excinuclease ABC subunit UvrC [Accumulibacter sp.]
MNQAFDAKALLATLTELPGVYRMFDDNEQLLYVGKAKNLRKRLASYFRDQPASPRIGLMVAQVARVETTVTRSEAEALLLENNLIKRCAPRYNILFRDDKSYPYIVLTHDPQPRLGFFRGATGRRADYFGPFPSSLAVRESIHLLQKMFRLRTCENSVFSNRARPCLLYQIKRCSGPCVGLIDDQQYAHAVQLATLFLQGRQQDVIKRLSQAMDAAAGKLAFEEATIYRDQIQSLRQVQEKQHVDSGNGDDVDIVVAVEENGMICVNLAMVRGGRHLGDRPQFPADNATSGLPADALTAFLYQHYLHHPIPARIIVNVPPSDDEVADWLSATAKRPLKVLVPHFNLQRVWVEMATQNAHLAIIARRSRQSRQTARLEALCQELALDVEDGQEARIECLDISHTQGENTVAACVVYQGDGMRKSEYRRFNINDIRAGDDYAAIRQTVLRRYGKLLTDGQGADASGPANASSAPSSPNWRRARGTQDEQRASSIDMQLIDSAVPTLILIDGGAGQVAAAAAALAELGLAHLPLLGVAKGEARKPGLETLVFADGREPVQWSPENPALHLIQEIRDEAHRFAITGHRAKRGKTGRSSRLEEIDGIGPKRRKALVARFGGLQGITDAGIDQLSAVPGISRELAEKIYAALH